MSLINKMLQDLDRRQALATAGDAPVIEVRATPNRKGDRHQRWWVIIVILLLAALAWAGWMAMPKLKAVLTPVGSEAPAPAQKTAPVAPAPAITPPPPASAVEQAVPAAPAAPVAAPASPP